MKPVRQEDLPIPPRAEAEGSDPVHFRFAEFEFENQPFRLSAEGRGVAR